MLLVHRWLAGHDEPQGGREEPFEGEERILIPSPQVATYDLQPEMSAPEVTDRIVEAIEGIRNAVGTPLVMNYVWAGLFHPARKVRQPYWRIYNDAYVQSADAMVPAYPAFEEENTRRNIDNSNNL